MQRQVWQFATANPKTEKCTWIKISRGCVTPIERSIVSNILYSLSSFRFEGLRFSFCSVAGKPRTMNATAVLTVCYVGDFGGKAFTVQLPSKSQLAQSCSNSLSVTSQLAGALCQGYILLGFENWTPCVWDGSSEFSFLEDKKKFWD